MIITIYGQTPAQKNSKNVGRNRYTNKTFVTSSKNVKDWQKDALSQLLGRSERFSGKIRIDYRFYVKDNLQRDLDNMITSVNDLLQVANAEYALKKDKMRPVKGTGMIVGDHWQVLEIGSAKAEIDRENPRAEMSITKL
jgi:Holliday junction resolvase RusA-like endonuclease